MKNAVLFLLSVFIGLASFAQTTAIGKITGNVIDSTSGQPVSYATISLFKTGSTTPVTGALSDEKGNFTIDNVNAGNYLVKIEFVGYKPKSLRVTVSNNAAALNLKSIVLSSSVATLGGVVVTAQKKLVENRIDKLVFNAENDITSQTGAATDVLKKVPQISVDMDGNVELAGSSSIRFLINGKPSSAFGSNISDVLQSIPANQIKSIEVITNPGAKYDAEGLGGIINIILKKSTTRGINGNISVTGGTRMENGSFNFNARRGKLGVNAFISGNYRPNATTPSSSDRLSTDSSGKQTLLHQDGEGQFNRHGFQTGVGFDWSPDEKNSLSGSLSYNKFGFSGGGNVNQDQLTTAPGGNVLSDILSYSNRDQSFQFHNIDASVNYKKTFSKEDQELDISLSTSLGNSFSRNNNLQSLQPEDSLYYGINSTNPGKQNETQFQLDYTHPLRKNVLLGLGGKTSFMDIVSSSSVLSLQPVTQSYELDSYLSSNLDYHQKVYAAYSELSFPVGKLFNAKLGGRYERTEINSFYSNALKQENTPGYNTFVPSVFLSKKLGENQMIKLSYSKRINRPDYRDLNPFINTSDPKNITAGNPNLQPEIGNRYELGYNTTINKVGFFMASLFYRTSNHDIQPFVVYYPTLKIGDSTYTNVSVSSRENIGLEKNMGVNLFADLRFIPKFNMRTNAFFFKRHIINEINPGYNSNSFNYRLNLNASYQISNTFSAEFFGNFNSARHEVQGRYPSWTSYSIAVRKQFWNKKGSLALTTTNPFSEYVNQKTEVYGPNFNLVSLRQIPFRSFGINFTWKFGKLEFKKEKENTDVNMNAPME